jgi:hypothetical protein
MRIGGLLRVLGACLLLAVCFTTNALSQPEPVPRMRDRALDKASYVALANQWREYIEKHGETANALVNLGMAQRYSSELEAAKRAGKRAVELEPDNPKALDFYAECIMLDGGADEAEKLLERSRTIDPDYGEALMSLAALYLRFGKFEKATATLKAMFDRRIISRPLQDFAYNMLIGLPTGAVLITNGDNDTFPPLALQVGMDFRNDVVVINWTLLRMPEYVDALRREHAFLKSAERSKTGTAAEDPHALVAQWIKDQKVPLYIAVTVSEERLKELGLKPDPAIEEGLSRRVAGKGLTAEEAARLVLERFRLDSATDWDFAWDLTPTASKVMMINYVSSMVNLAQRDGVPADLKCRLLGRAAAIAEFHHLSTEAQVKALLKKCEAK